MVSGRAADLSRYAAWKLADQRGELLGWYAWGTNGVPQPLPRPSGVGAWSRGFGSRLTVPAK